MVSFFLPVTNGHNLEQPWEDKNICYILVICIWRTSKTMAALEAAISLCSVYSAPSSSSAKFYTLHKPFLYPLKLHTSVSAPLLSHNFLSYPPSPILSCPTTRRLCFELCCAVQEIVVEDKPEQTQVTNQKRKLYVVNLPWSLTVVDIKDLFGECGTVADVEVVSGISFFFLLLSSLCHFVYVNLEWWVWCICVQNLDYKATKWKEQRLCLCDNGFSGGSSGRHR